MGFYSQRILPYLFEWSLSDPTIAQYRREVLANVTGEVLEIGFGTGINLSYYPKSIQKLVAIDTNPGVRVLAQKRIQKSHISVVSTWTLCSIANVEQALQEIYRVLKPGGKFFFVEHGLSNEPQVQVWQNRLTPIQKVIADGCHFNRNIRQIIEKQFDSVTLKEFYAEKTPKFVGYLYQGVATKTV